MSENSSFQELYEVFLEIIKLKLDYKVPYTKLFIHKLLENSTMPCEVNLDVENDGTIAPCGAVGSIVFTPKESIKAVEYYYNTFPKLWGKYGFKDGYNLENNKKWFSNEYIGIDKGIGMIMIENYFNETI